jgi:hypothetical protein
MLCITANNYINQCPLSDFLADWTRVASRPEFALQIPNSLCYSVFQKDSTLQTLPEQWNSTYSDNILIKYEKCILNPLQSGNCSWRVRTEYRIRMTKNQSIYACLSYGIFFNCSECDVTVWSLTTSSHPFNNFLCFLLWVNKTYDSVDTVKTHS